MPRKDAVMAQASSTSAQAQQDLVGDGIEKFELPRTLVTKIARSAIPDSAKMQKESVLALVKGSTVFINYLAAAAHDVAISKQHKSISASDVLKALETIQFGDLLPVMSEELAVYRELAKTDKSRRGIANTTPSATAQANATGNTATATKKGKGKAVNGKGKGTDTNAMDVDNPDGEGEDTAGEDGDAAEGEEDNENDAEEDEGDDQGAEEEPQDQVALEEEELDLVNRGMESARYVGTEAGSAPPS